jgi:peroxiredoxin Q/BCP
MPVIEEGKKAPAFKLKDQNGAVHELKSFAGKPVVLYFYPKDDTSSCTVEACSFRDRMPAFEKIDAVVLGVSPDDEKSHAKFVKKHGLNFTLLSDTPGKDGVPPVCGKYGVWVEKSMYGKKYMGVARTTYLIDGSGKVVKRWDKVKSEGHAGEVLEALAEL